MSSDIKSNENPETLSREKSVDLAKATGADFLATAGRSESLGRNFAVRSLIAIALNGPELRRSAELEIVEEESKSTRKYFAETSFLTGYYKVKVGQGGHDKVSKSNLSKTLSYAAELVEALEWLLKTGGTEKKLEFKHKVTDTENDFEKIVAIRDSYTVQNLLRDYRKHLQSRRTRSSNERSVKPTDTLKGIANDFGSGVTPIGAFHTPASTLSSGDLGLAVCRWNDDQLEVHEVLSAPDRLMLDALRHSTDLPTTGIDDRVNFVAEVLHVASMACRDQDSSIPLHSGSVSSARKKENNRQFLFLPYKNEIVIGYSRGVGLPSIRIEGLSCWPFRPTEPGLLRTQQRREIDKFVNRVDRRKFTIGDAVREKGQKWVSKFYFVPQGSGGGRPLQIDPFFSHRLDVFAPDVATARWEAIVTFDRNQLLELHRRHLSPYSKSKKADGDARIVTFSFENGGMSFQYKGIKAVDVSCAVNEAPENALSVQAIGKDWADIVKALVSLEMTEDVILRVDSTGVFEFTTMSRHATYAFYVAAVLPGEDKRSDRFFQSARRLLEDQSAKTAEEAA